MIPFKYSPCFYINQQITAQVKEILHFLQLQCIHHTHTTTNVERDTKKNSKLTQFKFVKPFEIGLLSEVKALKNNIQQIQVPETSTGKCT